MTSPRGLAYHAPTAAQMVAALRSCPAHARTDTLAAVIKVFAEHGELAGVADSEVRDTDVEEGTTHA